MKMKRVFALLLVSVFILVALAACGNGDTSTAEPRDVVIALNQNIITLDPHAPRDGLSNNVISNMVEGLVEFDQQMVTQPCLAESWEITPDGLKYTFKLRQGVKFHDGEPFNADAVRANVERVRDPDLALRHARSFTMLDRMETPDEYTVIFHLVEPFSPFLQRLEPFKIISPKELEANRTNPDPIGTGGFSFVEWIDGERMVMKKFPEWRNANQIQVDTVTWRFILENGTRVAMLQSGEAHLIFPMPSESVSLVSNNNDFVLEAKDSTVCRFVMMNQNVEPMDNVLVRRAINHAVSSAEFAQIVRGGYANPLLSAMSPLLPWYVEQQEYAHDLDKARELLAQAGYPDGFTITLWASTGSEDMRGLEFLSQQLGQIGINAIVEPAEEATLSDMIYNTTPETTNLNTWYVSWSAFDPDNALRSPFMSTMWPPAGANCNYYDNPEVDAAILAGNRAITFEEQLQHYGRAQQLIWEDAVWVFLGVDISLMAKSADLTGAQLAPTGSFLDIRTIGLNVG